MVNLQFAVYAGVKLACDQLTDAEFVGMNLVVMTEQSPKNRTWYEKVSFLFTQEDGEKMHADTLAAFNRYATDRMASL